MKRLFTILAALVLVVLCFVLMPAEASAAGITASGTCGADGDNLTWILDSDGTLTISGSGDMVDFPSSNSPPWVSWRQSIKKVVVENGVTSISFASFWKCTNLGSVILGNDVAEIHGSAFEFCSNLTSVTIGNGITSIGSSAFNGCNLKYNTYSGASYLGNSSNPYVALMRAYGSSPIIHEDARAVAYGAFQECTNLTHITIPGNITTIGGHMFYDCSNLVSVVLEPGVTSINSYAFRDCTNLTNISIPDSVTSIGEYAFSNCASLNSITIGKGVTNIGNYAFNNCSNLASIAIPDSVTSIGQSVFNGCTKLTYNAYGNAKYLGNDTNPYLILIDTIATDITECVIADTTKCIYDYAFKGCTNLIGITIPDSVTHIGDCAFCDCTSLTHITIPDSVTNIGEYAFSRCSSLTDMTIGDGVTSIGRYAFNSCAGLTSLIIPDSVKNIEEYAFDGCTNLTNITIGSGVMSIAEGVFDGCNKLQRVYISDMAAWCNISFYYYSDMYIGMSFYLTEECSNPIFQGADLYLNGELVTDLVIPESVTAISHYAFYYYDDLTSVTIPKSVTEIGIAAFGNCVNLSTVNYCGTQETWEKIAIDMSTDWGHRGNAALVNAKLSYHKWSDSNCVTRTVCTICGEVGDYGHLWLDATCTSAKFCFICGVADGEALGHNWIESCTEPKTCLICGETDGAAPGHFWNGATCTKPKTCTVCGQTEGTSLGGHIWQAATCTTPKTCTTCGQTEGSVQHNWVAATCTTPKTCSLCGATEGAALGHSWQNATCLKPKYCKICVVTEGTISDHAYSNANDAFCNVCNYQRILSAPSLTFYGTPGLSFQEYIGIQVLLINQSVADYDKVYVVAVQQTPNGEVTGTTYGIPYAVNYTIFEQQIVSWSMTEQVTMTLYGKKDGIVYQGVTITTSVKKLAEDKLAAYKAQGNAKVCRALVDMLNYGAAVQTYYDYNAANLPNTDIENYLSYGSTNTPELTATNSITGTGTVTVYGDNISLQDKVEFNLMFYNADLVGKEVKASVGGEAVDVFYNTEIAPGWTIARVAVETSKMREVYTIALYDEEGNAVSQIYEVSVEGYAKARAGTAKAVVDVALMRYGDSVSKVG